MDSIAQRKLNLLLVAPDRQDASGIVEQLNAMGNMEVYTHVATDLASALQRLSRGDVEILLLNLDLPDSRGLVTFERAFAFAPRVPILVISNDDEDEVAISAVKGGAQDCIPRGELTPGVLRRAIRHGLERHRLLSALRSLSLIDDLTGLYNRRGFTDLGEQFLKLGRRAGKGASVIFLDVDRFKTINDTLGHHVGDRALNRVADILRTAFRQSDLIARMGGDEFAVLAPESGEEAHELADRVRRAVAEWNDVSRDPFQLQVSVGGAVYDGEGRIRLEDLLTEADRAMYEEKRSKRKVVSQ